jgi:hypothetical protein
MKQKQKALKLIEESKSINSSQKRIYSDLVNILPEEQLKKLYEIFRKEKELVEKIEKERKEKESDINKRYLEEITETVKKTEKEAIKKEEKEEGKNAGKILEQL